MRGGSGRRLSRSKQALGGGHHACDYACGLRCSARRASPCSDKATIEKLNDAFEAAFNKADFAAVGNMYTEDAYLLPPGSELAKGRSNVQAFWTKAGEAVSDLKLTTVDVKPLGSDAAREVGTFSLMTKGQQRQQVVGKYVVVWQKVGNEWKLATDIWNTDK